MSYGKILSQFTDIMTSFSYRPMKKNKKPLGHNASLGSTSNKHAFAL